MQIEKEKEKGIEERKEKGTRERERMITGEEWIIATQTAYPL